MSPSTRSIAALMTVACLLCGLLPGAAAQACQAGCMCGEGRIICHEDFVVNPPKSAMLVRGLKPFCSAVELELLQLGSKRCATPMGRLMDCVRQVVDPMTPAKLCDFHPSLEQTKCTCPGASEMCKQLALFKTRAHGSYVPAELYRTLGCTPPASGLRTKVSTMLRSDQCQGFATQVTTYAKIAVRKFWPKIQEVLPDPLKIDSTRTSFPRTDIGVFYVDGWAGLDAVKGIKTLALPDFKVDSMTTCTNLSSLQSKVSLSTSISSLSAKGGAGITLDNWMMTVPLELSLTLTVTDTKVGIKGSTTVGIFPTMTSAGVSAAVTSIDSVDLKLGDIDIDLQFIVWTPFTWVLGKVLSLFTSLVRSIAPSLEQNLNDVLKGVLNDNLKYMAANVDI